MKEFDYIIIGGGWSVVGCGEWWWEAPGYHGRPQASSRAQILAQCRESSPLATPPGPLKLRSLGGNTCMNKYEKINKYLHNI